MRVYGPNGTGPVVTPSGERRTASGTFTLGGEEPARAATAAAAPRTLGGIDALIALQGLDDLPERRRRGLKRGRRALDALEALKLALLTGPADSAALASLKVAAGALGESSGDPGLDSVLAEIALRAEVELAKLGLAPEQSRE
jgi:hypothetical protein